MSTSFKLEMTRGDTAAFAVHIVDADTGDDVNLTGLVLTFTAKHKYEDADADAVFVKTLGDGIAVVSAEAGTATITVSPEDTDDLTYHRTLVWDLQVEDGADVRTPLRGTLAVRRDVTQGVSVS